MPAHGWSVPVERAKNDAAFNAQMAERKARATALTQKTEGWVYLLEPATVQKVLIPRQALLKEKPQAPAKAVTPASVEEGGMGPGAESPVDAK